MDHSSSSSEISFHGLPSKSKCRCIRKQRAASLSSQLIVLSFLQNSHLQRDIKQTFFRHYFSEFSENSWSASKSVPKILWKLTKKTSAAKSYFSKVADFYRSSHRRFSVKKVILERCLQNSQESTCIRDLVLIKLQA